MKVSQAVILAAGESSRFWPLNYQHKSLFSIMGRPLIYYTIKELERLGLKEVVIIQGPQKDIEEGLKGYEFGLEIKYLVQPEAKGMGDALSLAKELVKGPFFVLNPYHFEIGQVAENMVEKLNDSELVLLGKKTDRPENYGILNLKNDKALGIIEKPPAGQAPSDIMVIGIYLLSPEFFTYYQEVKRGMYDFEEALNLFMKEKEAKVVITEEEAPSLKYPWDLLKLNRALMDNYLETKIEESAQVAKNSVIEDRVYVGKEAKIMEGAVIKGPCYIGDNAIVGTNSLVRKYADLEEGAMVGAQAEVARSIFQKDAHVHSGYFGDSIFGEGCRVGAGTVTANVRLDRGEVKVKVKNEKVGSGLNSLGVISGKKTNIGINSSLMPGILIGSECVIGPASVVFDNIEDCKIFYTKFQNEPR